MEKNKKTNVKKNEKTKSTKVTNKNVKKVDEEKNITINSSVQKDKLIKVFKIVGIVIGIVALFVLVFLSSNLREGNELISFIEDTSVEKYFELRNSDEKSVILFASPNCSWCQQYRPIINKVSADYELTIYYVNTNLMTNDEYNQVYASSTSMINEGGLGTPFTLLVQSGQDVDYIEGAVDYDKLVSFLTKNGVIE